MLDFDERDLLDFAQRAGFADLELNFEVRISSWPERDWDTFYRSSGNPLAPPLEEAMIESLTAPERRRFVAHLRPSSSTGTEP